MLKKFFKKAKSSLTKSRYLDRNATLLPWMLGKNFIVKNGKGYSKVEVVALRLYSKAGDFVFTRKSPVHKVKKRR